MLQPLQLKDVSARHANEIAELRDFLQKADCVLETAESLYTIANRLQRDRAFHRDLTSHLWVVIHSCNRIISYADLLGVLAIAAAGTHFAAEAHEDDAHALLRFVIEARQSLDGVNQQKNTPAIYSPVVPPPPVQSKVVSEQAILDPQARPLLAELPSLEAEETDGSRKRFIWIAACVLAVLSTVLVLHYRTTPDEATSPAPAATVATETSAPIVSKENIPPSLRSEAAPRVATPSSTMKRSTRATPVVSLARSSHKPLAKKPSIPGYPPALPLRVTAAAAVAAPTVPPQAPNASSPLVSHSESTPASVARNVPAGTSATPLGSSSASTDSSAPDLSNTVRERQGPRLLRRTPEEQADLVAELRPPDIGTSQTSPNATLNASRGTVQAISLGTNAANVLYSPIPAYPSAASAAHVQGEVKLQANVDSKGNVASVRVISGPPLLREAALDAAQRWRYRPNIAAGEPIPMNAITVFEFQLP